MRFLLLAALAMAACAATPDGAAVFESHCATCHQTVTGSRTPTRAELGNLTPEQVMTALAAGQDDDARRRCCPPARFAPSRCMSRARTFQQWPWIPRRAAARAIRSRFLPERTIGMDGACNLSNARYQPKPGFQAEDAPRLKLKWAFGFPDDTQAAGQPVIVGGRVFVGSNGGTVYSLDASTGCVYWTYDAGGIVRSAISIVRSPKSSRWIAYFGDYHASAHAVDAETGKPLWKVKMDEHPAARISRVAHVLQRPALCSGGVVRRTGRRHRRSMNAARFAAA